MAQASTKDNTYRLPPEEKKTARMIYVSDTEWARVEQAARGSHSSMSRYVRVAIREKMERDGA